MKFLSRESFLNHLEKFASSCLWVGVGKKSSLMAQNNLILWERFRLSVLYWFWWVFMSSFNCDWSLRCVWGFIACLWITRVWWQRYCMFVFGFLFGREPEKPLVVHRADLQTARGSGVWRGGGFKPPAILPVCFIYIPKDAQLCQVQ